jgi:hypothetical protein
MVGKQVRSEATQQLLSDLVWKLHNRVIPRSFTSVFHQSDSRKDYKTLRSAERAPTLSAGGKLNQPFSQWRWVFLFILSFNKIVFHFLKKVDGHVSRASRDKCPEQS